MSQVAISLLLAIVCSTACEQRKGTLLPARNSDQKGAQKHLESVEPEVNKGSLSAKSLPEELRGPNDLGELTEDSSEINDLDKVKQDALNRIRKPSATPLVNGSAAQMKAHNFFQRGQRLATLGKTQESQELFLIACQLGNAQGCHKFGWLEAKSGNPANARQFYKLACESGLNKSCNNLGVQFEKEHDWDEALNSYAKACLGKHQISCENLKRLRVERLKLR